MFLVRFADVWMADQLTSLGDFLFMLQFVWCTYPEGTVPTIQQFCATSQSWGIPVLNALPYYFRLQMSIRRFFETENYLQLVNVVKYIISIAVILIACMEKIFKNADDALFATWIVLKTIEQLFKFCWDTMVDWQLFQCIRCKKPNKWYRFGLRDELLYSQIWVHLNIGLTTLVLFCHCCRICVALHVGHCHCVAPNIWKQNG